MTGDSPEQLDFNSKDDYDLIIATPEKFDATSRRFKDQVVSGFINRISLVLIDEVHLLDEKQRGASLEALVSRLKVLQKKADSSQLISQIRFIAVSATIPNVEDIALWLNNAELKVFNDDVRPVKIDLKVLAFPNQSTNDFLFDQSLNYKLLPIIMEHNGDHPTLIFCNTRKATSVAALQIQRDLMNMKNCGRQGNPFVKTSQQQRCLDEAALKVDDKQLANLLKYAVAFHHAGLSFKDRKIVEDLFLKEHILVLTTTSTLAIGVNMPALCVIVKGTKQYISGSGYTEYSPLQMTQMLGRCGRNAEISTTATAIIMTEHSTRNLYEAGNIGPKPIESGFLNSLIEHFNAEVTVHLDSLVTAITWISSTFFYVRIQKNPQAYYRQLEAYLDMNMKTATIDPDIVIPMLCEKTIEKLAREHLVTYDDLLKSTIKNLNPTELGIAMSRYDHKCIFKDIT